MTFTGHTMVTITAKATADGTPALRYHPGPDHRRRLPVTARGEIGGALTGDAEPRVVSGLSIVRGASPHPTHARVTGTLPG